MSRPRKIQREQAPPPAEPRQMSIVFESNGLRGLSQAERTKAIMNLAHLDAGGRDRGRGEQR